MAARATSKRNASKIAYSTTEAPSCLAQNACIWKSQRAMAALLSLRARPGGRPPTGQGRRPPGQRASRLNELPCRNLRDRVNRRLHAREEVGNRHAERLENG